MGPIPVTLNQVHAHLVFLALVPSPLSTFQGNLSVLLGNQISCLQPFNNSVSKVSLGIQNDNRRIMHHS